MSDAPSFRPLRARRWTRAKMVAFLRALRETNSVSHASASVGMSRQSAYRLRRRLETVAARGSAAEAFLIAWDMVRDGKVPVGPCEARPVTLSPHRPQMFGM